MTVERVFRLGVFEIEGDYGPYPGFTCNDTWNGWACPYFTRAIADVVVARWNTLAELTDEMDKAHYDAARDCYVFPEAMYAVDDATEVHGMDILALDVSFCVHVYPIGAFAWIWDECLPDRNA